MRGTAPSILGITSRGDWLDVRGVMAGEGENVRVARYHDVGLPIAVPADVTDALRERSKSSQTKIVCAPRHAITSNEPLALPPLAATMRSYSVRCGAGSATGSLRVGISCHHIFRPYAALDARAPPPPGT